MNYEPFYLLYWKFYGIRFSIFESIHKYNLLLYFNSSLWLTANIVRRDLKFTCEHYDKKLVIVNADVRLRAGSPPLSCCRSSKQDGSVDRFFGHVARMSDSQDTFRALLYVDPRAAQGLETPPRTSMSHLASDPKMTSIRSTTDSTQHGHLPRTENDGGNSWKRLRSWWWWWWWW